MMASGTPLASFYSEGKTVTGAAMDNRIFIVVRVFIYEIRAERQRSVT